MIEPSFLAQLVATIGAASLTEPGFSAASGAAIALSAITVFADPEHGAASVTTANSLPENRLAMKGHLRRQAGLDNGNRSWQVRTSFDDW